jgi:hypothetical protein
MLVDWERPAEEFTLDEVVQLFELNYSSCVTRYHDGACVEN